MNKRNNSIPLQQLKQSKVWEQNKHKFENPSPKTGGKKVAKHFPRASKEKDFIAWNLLYWCNEHAVVSEDEYKFHPERKFRFDHAIPSLMIAVEYEGLFSDKSGHTTPGGYTKDTDKYNLAQSMGWIVIRLTAMNYKSLIKELNNAYQCVTNRNK
jgi:hypothetical protein